MGRYRIFRSVFAAGAAVLLTAAPAFAQTLTATFSIGAAGTDKSTAKSVAKNTPDGLINDWAVQDVVTNDKVASVFDYSWTSEGPRSAQRLPAPAGGAQVSRTNKWNIRGIRATVQVSTTGSITLTATPPNPLLGGTFPAQRWMDGRIRVAGGNTGRLYGESYLGDTTLGGATLVASFTSDSTQNPDGTYSITYTITNPSTNSTPMNYNWAGYSGTLNPGEAFTATVASANEPAPVDATANYMAGSDPSATIAANYWSPQ